MKTGQALARLTRVDLRDIFVSEAGDFTPWLAQHENLKLLAETIGLELECEAQEKWVGPYRADILCKDINTQNWVLIENQIEKTDHTHLGQLLTYAAGLDAVTIVWIAQRFTEEHRAAMDWLNEHTSEEINLFALEIELWRIGSSPVAPKFNIVSQPNDWSKTVKAAASQSGESTEHNQFQVRFWTAFREYMEANSQIRCQKARPQHWMIHTIGRGGLNLNSVVSTWSSITGKASPELRVELSFNDSHAKEFFALVERGKQEIEKQIGSKLVWHNPPENKQAKIYVRKDVESLDEPSWPQHFAWLKTNLELFNRVFGPIVLGIDLTKSEAASAGH